MPFASQQSMYEVQHKQSACRKCSKNIFEDDHVCPHCETGAPGIYSHCPECQSENYVYHYYGYNFLRGILAVFVCFPLLAFFQWAPVIGLLFGFYGSKRTECICLDCGQGWFPYDTSSLTRFNVFVEDEKATCTRKFKKIPANCYDKAAK